MSHHNGPAGFRAGTDPSCARPSGTQPRNRQHRAAEYFFGKSAVCKFLAALTPTKVLSYNPYRTQLVFSARLGEGSFGILLGHSQNSFPFLHHVLILRPGYTNFVPLGTAAYAEPIILSWPTHGPLVCEEWWAMADSPSIDELVASEYFYSD